MRSFKEFVASGPAFVASSQSRGANLGPTNPHAPEQNSGIISIQNVRAGRIWDARCLDMNPQSKKQAIEAMLGAVKNILTSDGREESARVQVADVDREKLGKEALWGQLFPNAVPFENGIHVQYRPTATRNLVGRSLWSMGDVNRRPFQVAAEKMGLRQNPETFYKRQFENELEQLKNNRLLIGWPENWEIDTTVAGRDIILRLKEPKII